MAPVKHTVLLITEDHTVLSLLKGFQDAGYDILTAPNASAAFMAMLRMPPSLVVADRQWCPVKTLRTHNNLLAIPIISFVPAGITCSEDECLADYHHGADLVLRNQTTKELIAWVRAILRRQQTDKQAATHILAGEIHMELDRHEVRVDGKLIELTRKEFCILRSFLESPDRVFSRQDMLNRVWGDNYALEEHALDVHIHSLRQKIENNPAKPKFIVTVRGFGYKLRAAPSSIQPLHQLTGSDF